MDWQIHTGPADELHTVELASDDVDDAQHKLNVAVRAARDAGASLADIGRAVGISRQSAHERWAKMLAE
ncbi:AsnC family protein [Nocardia carnea]|uniref:AsnC family protein n=1 Tax=Nocardia carnea TaxID=37328 RepID=UPI002458FAAC|nr:AsnC family protein [Nocardia carnea]